MGATGSLILAIFKRYLDGNPNRFNYACPNPRSRPAVDPSKIEIKIPPFGPQGPFPQIELPGPPDLRPKSSNWLWLGAGATATTAPMVKLGHELVPRRPLSSPGALVMWSCRHGGVGFPAFFLNQETRASRSGRR
jgi:hypothetical protein